MTTTITYNVEKGLLTVEKLLPLDANPKNVRIMRGIIQKWRALMKSTSLDEGCVIEYLTLDRYAMNEALIDGSPLCQVPHG